jgi:hypothetical protein
MFSEYLIRDLLLIHIRLNADNNLIHDDPTEDSDDEPIDEDLADDPSDEQVAFDALENADYEEELEYEVDENALEKLEVLGSSVDNPVSGVVENDVAD